MTIFMRKNMKKKVFYALLCVGLLLSGLDAQAQEKKKKGFGGFLDKVNNVLSETNQALEDVNSTLDGTANNATKNGGVKVTSPTRNLKLEYKGNYVEGNDVVVEFMLSNMTDKSIGLNWGGGTAWDDLGNSYSFGDMEFTIGGKEVSPMGVEVPAEVPVKAVIRLRKVDSKAKAIAKITIDTYQYKGFQVRKFTIAREEM